MHTILVITGGFVLLGVMILIGRSMGGASSPAAARAALYFIPIWLIAAAVNLWVGVSTAGYTVAEEFPILLVVFGIPALAAGLLWWRYSRARTDSR